MKCNNTINILVLLKYLLIKVYCCLASNCQSCLILYCDECIPGYYVYYTFCYQCSINCNTCSSEYTCTSCTDGFYLTSNSDCLACQQPCSTCIQSKSNCLTCYESQNQQPPQCNCISQKYMNDQYQCKNCVIPCLTCSSQFICLTCVESYYLSETKCLQCSQPCAKCDISSTNCITCIGQFRSPPNCNCNQGYLLNVSNQCQKCTFPCLTCQNTFTECLSCYNSYTHNPQVNQCNCLENQTEIISSPNYCINCQLPCITCKNSATECLICITGTILSGTKCICSNDYYFDHETDSCQQCKLPCKSCISKSLCLECYIPQQILDDCHCPIGEYLTSSFECQKCRINCSECTDSITCQKCGLGYYLSDLKECIKCENPCVTCQNQNYQCLSCILNSQLTNDKNCICNDGYYMNSLKECQLCDQPCLTCINDSITCKKCIEKFILSNNNTCICQDGTFLDVQLSRCNQCETPCSKCIDNKNTCLSCIDQNQILIGQKCFCKQGWLINNENKCDQCKEPCFKCQETLTQCMSCKDSDHTLIDGECVCPENYGDDVNYNCIPCDSPCQKCQFTSSSCLTCISEQHVLTSQNECKCKTGFMMNIYKQCDACHISCKECELNVSNCIVCKDTYHQLINGNCQCKSGFITDQNFNCVPCQSPCQTCQMNTNICLTCINNDFYVNEKSKCVCVDFLKQNLQNKCECISGYYKKNEICHQCSFPCNECWNQDFCISCYNIDQVILKNNKCVCDSGYFQQKDQCNKCDKLCFTCINDENNCTSCDQSQLRVLNNNICVCQNGYFENSQHLCESCISDNGKFQDICSVIDCNDKQWIYSEQCDDGNDVPRDGCTNCFIDKFYSCYNQIFQRSKCYQCPPYCKQCLISEYIQIVCIECEQDYFVDHQSCSKCSDKCLGCKSSSFDRVSCRFIKNSIGECQLCESEVGSYSNYQQNQCYTKCGDGIKSKNEECDDGNIIDGDGCNSICKQETKFICKDGTCITPSYPKPIFKIIGDTSEYQQLRQFELTYDQELKFNSTFKLQDYFQLFIIFDNKERQIDYQTNFTQYINFTEINQQGFITLIINIFLPNDSQNEKILIKFHNNFEIISNQGYYQQETDISCEIMPVIFIQQDTINQVQRVTKTNQYILYIISAISIGAILFGGIEIFYNLLDLLQLLSYLKYINTNLPYSLQEFFKLFEVFQFKFLTEYLKFNYQIGNFIDFSLIQRQSPKLYNENITSLFIINAFPICLVFLSSFCIYGLAFLFSKILNLINLKNDQIIQTNKKFLIKAVLLFYNLRIFVNSFYYQIKIKLFYSGIYRIYISIAYDFAFSIILQLNNLEFYSDLLLVSLSSFLAILSLIVYLANIYFIIKISGMSNYAIQNYQNQLKYGSIFEGVNIKSKNCRYLTAIQLTKKFISMHLFILAYQLPVFQILNLIFLSIFMNIYMIVFKPLNDKLEFIKQFICDISITCTQINILILVYDSQVKYFYNQTRENIGWSCIFFMSSIIIIQILVDSKQQWTLLFKNFKILGKFLLKIQNFLKKQNNQTTPKVFLSK